MEDGRRQRERRFGADRLGAAYARRGRLGGGTGVLDAARDRSAAAPGPYDPRSVVTTCPPRAPCSASPSRPAPRSRARLMRRVRCRLVCARDESRLRWMTRWSLVAAGLVPW